jgi:hypothetical protein
MNKESFKLLIGRDIGFLTLWSTKKIIYYSKLSFCLYFVNFAIENYYYGKHH